MKKDKVLDSCALLAYFEGEPVGLKVRELLKEAAEKDQELFLCVVNWGEVLYVIEHRAGKAKRDEIAHLMSQMHLRVIDADQELTWQAAAFKAAHKMSYADCFAAALAKLKKAELVTGDKEFHEVEDAIHIKWL
ncbi:MAG: type II toxin-antitoxin system VapC family toxin [Elusimicrobia bacterium]|nr:type II toxin-antitoxin system VapC family toxin [Elusimicrobiota bacterium]